MPAEIKEELVLRILNKVWRGEGLLEEWRTGVIYPIHKRGDRSNVKNYWSVTLLNIAYNIYASILNDMLVKELEAKLGKEQWEFRKGRGTIDAIYILNHIVNS